MLIGCVCCRGRLLDRPGHVRRRLLVRKTGKADSGSHAVDGRRSSPAPALLHLYSCRCLGLLVKTRLIFGSTKLDHCSALLCLVP